MRTFRVLPLALLLMPLFSFGQKIQYSRQTFRYSFVDAMQLVADVGGYHHVLGFKMNSRPVIHIFNSQLEYTGRADVDISVEETSDIRIVPMQGFYYLYFHTPGSLAHAVYKVSGSGGVVDKTDMLNKMPDSLVPKSTATYQLQNHQNQLFILSHTYYNEIKKVGSTIVLLDEQWNVVNSTKVFYPFSKGKESLQQVVLANHDLFVLKTGIDKEQGNTLQVVKTNLQTGTSLIKTFSAENHVYSNASMLYATEDSSVLLHATMREQGISRRLQLPIFIARLDYQLAERKPFTLFKLPPRRNIIAGFLFVNGKKPVWLSPYDPVLPRRRNQAREFKDIAQDDKTFRMSTNPMLVDESEISHGQHSSVRFTVLNNQDLQIGDTTVENNGSFYDLQPRPNAQFTIGRKTCLLFLQNFTAKQKGLVLVYSDPTGHVTTTPVPVFDRFEYFIPQTQAKKDYFLLPYRDKKEMGLVKVTIGNGE